MNKTLISVAVVGLLAMSMTKPKSSTPKKELLVVIDVAHGGKDHGSHAHGIQEKEIVMQVAKQIALLDTEKDNIRFVFTRENDESITLANRVEFINKVAPDYVISLHVNQAKGSIASGAELYINGDNEQAELSKALANSLSQTVSSNIVDCNASTKEAGFYLLKHSAHPTVLFEMGFISSDNDHAYLTSEQGQLLLARSIIEGLVQLER